MILPVQATNLIPCWNNRVRFCRKADVCHQQRSGQQLVSHTAEPRRRTRLTISWRAVQQGPELASLDEVPDQCRRVVGSDRSEPAVVGVHDDNRCVVAREQAAGLGDEDVVVAEPPCSHGSGHGGGGVGRPSRDASGSAAHEDVLAVSRDVLPRGRVQRVSGADLSSATSLRVHAAGTSRDHAGRMDDDITLPCTSCGRYTCRCAEFARSADRGCRLLGGLSYGLQGPGDGQRWTLAGLAVDAPLRDSD